MVFSRSQAALHVGLKAGMAAPATFDGKVVAVLLFLASDPGTLDRGGFEAVAATVERLGPVLMQLLKFDQMKGVLQEQQTLLREVHHRVKNILNAIAILLSLQSAQAGESGAAALVRESEARVRSMLLLHEQLHRSQDWGWVA